jgi:hypothetical protein
MDVRKLGLFAALQNSSDLMWQGASLGLGAAQLSEGAQDNSRAA